MPQSENKNGKQKRKKEKKRKSPITTLIQISRNEQNVEKRIP